ncbi:hypothetical protein ElyMa_003076300 [Elysia marginata]|uniref:Uncharacterized protein n=1 Tax=Elysia marginata TaxID=1093978 RepID=A0AAV4IPB9_9GAST|nr:hypothetical protein ElyMa_003076300 [Elysia marginata]
MRQPSHADILATEEGDHWGQVQQILSCRPSSCLPMTLETRGVAAAELRAADLGSHPSPLVRPQACGSAGDWKWERGGVD